MKRLNEIVSDYLEANDAGDRAAFDAAMENEILRGDGYRLRDLMYEVYRLQKDVATLNCICQNHDNSICDLNDQIQELT